MEIFYIATIAVLVFFLAVGYLILSTILIEYHKLKYKKSNSTQEDLEIATTDQLVSELKKREQNPVIIVKTSNEGILVDCFNIPPALSVDILEASANLVRDKIRRQMEDFGDYS